MKKDDAPDWAAAVGAIALVLLLASLGLIAAGGWAWFAKFLESAAPAWVQAVGSVAAILASAALVRWQHLHERKRQAEHDREQRARRHAVYCSVAQLAVADAGWVRMVFKDHAAVVAVINKTQYLDPYDVDSIGKKLDDIPLHELDDVVFVARVRLLSEHCRNVRTASHWLLNNGATAPVGAVDMWLSRIDADLTAGSECVGALRKRAKVLADGES